MSMWIIFLISFKPDLKLQVSKLHLIHVNLRNKNNCMKALFIESNDSSNIKLLFELARKLNVKAHILSDEEKEDIALAKAILQEESGKYLTEEEIRKSLNE